MMELALARTGAAPLPVQHQLGPFGTSSGINTCPGCEDDGWVVPAPVTLSDGTRLHLFKDGEALHAAYRAIEDAKQFVCLEVYIFSGDDTGRAFARLLCEKALAGVRVYVIYDSFGSMHSGRGMFRSMRQAGARVRQFHPI